MRIVQHKSPSTPQGKDPVEVIGEFNENNSSFFLLDV